MKKMKTLTVNGETYQVTDPESARLDDTQVSENSTWSSQKIDEEIKNGVGDIETALDSIIAIQNELIGGDGV